eukprot:sb/3465987/
MKPPCEEASSVDGVYTVISHDHVVEEESFQSNHDLPCFVSRRWNTRYSLDKIITKSNIFRRSGRRRQTGLSLVLRFSFQPISGFERTDEIEFWITETEKDNVPATLTYGQLKAAVVDVRTVCGPIGWQNARLICKAMGYHTCSKLDYGPLPSHFSFEGIMISNCEMNSNDTAISCSFSYVSDCRDQASSFYSRYEFIGCGCRAGYYANPLHGCIKCPDSGLTHNSSQPESCSCNPGFRWKSGECEMCPKNTYGRDNTCLPCPTHSGSLPGATHCTCAKGYVEDKGVCVKCTPKLCPPWWEGAPFLGTLGTIVTVVSLGSLACWWVRGSQDKGDEDLVAAIEPLLNGEIRERLGSEYGSPDL